MNLGAEVGVVERQLARLQELASTTDADAIARAAMAIAAALEVMRFARSYDRTGPFRNAPFGATPQLPVGALWPEHATAIASLTTSTLAARKQLGDLLGALDALQRQLIFEADCAESTDALNNSRQYLQAAGFLDRAVAELVSVI